mmetsp:Transcript_67264/g.152137  ORF Transcript_67264/g.152137 Transcript_67264/m.152137 type:complete len:657 (-) Transcript_67264:3137-5107(-)
MNVQALPRRDAELHAHHLEGLDGHGLDVHGRGLDVLGGVEQAVGRHHLEGLRLGAPHEAGHRPARRLPELELELVELVRDQGAPSGHREGLEGWGGAGRVAVLVQGRGVHRVVEGVEQLLAAQEQPRAVVHLEHQLELLAERGLEPAGPADRDVVLARRGDEVLGGPREVHPGVDPLQHGLPHEPAVVVEFGLEAAALGLGHAQQVLAHSGGLEGPAVEARAEVRGRAGHLGLARQGHRVLGAQPPRRGLDLAAVHLECVEGPQGGAGGVALVREAAEAVGRAVVLDLDPRPVALQQVALGVDGLEDVGRHRGQVHSPPPGAKGQARLLRLHPAAVDGLERVELGGHLRGVGKVGQVPRPRAGVLEVESPVQGRARRRGDGLPALPVARRHLGQGGVGARGARARPEARAVHHQGGQVAHGVGVKGDNVLVARDAALDVLPPQGGVRVGGALERLVEADGPRAGGLHVHDAVHEAVLGAHPDPVPHGEVRAQVLRRVQVRVRHDRARALGVGDARHDRARGGPDRVVDAVGGDGDGAHCVEGLEPGLHLGDARPRAQLHAVAPVAQGEGAAQVARRGALRGDDLLLLQRADKDAVREAVPRLDGEARGGVVGAGPQPLPPESPRRVHEGGVLGRDRRAHDHGRLGEGAAAVRALAP